MVDFRSTVFNFCRITSFLYSVGVLHSSCVHACIHSCSSHPFPDGHFGGGCHGFAVFAVWNVKFPSLLWALIFAPGIRYWSIGVLEMSPRNTSLSGRPLRACFVHRLGKSHFRGSSPQLPSLEVMASPEGWPAVCFAAGFPRDLRRVTTAVWILPFSCVIWDECMD